MRTFIRVISLIGLLCSSGVPAIAEAPIEPNSGDKNALIIRSLFAAFNRHDVEGLASLYGPDAYLMSSDLSAPRHGPEGVRRTYSELFSQLPQIHDEVKTLIVRGDAAAISSYPHGALPAPYRPESWKSPLS